MSLFGKKKEEAKAETICCCGEKVKGICCIKVLGSGCKSCHQLYENTLKAVEELGTEISGNISMGMHSRSHASLW